MIYLLKLIVVEMRQIYLGFGKAVAVNMPGLQRFYLNLACFGELLVDTCTSYT